MPAKAYRQPLDPAREVLTFAGFFMYSSLTPPLSLPTKTWCAV